MRICVSNNWLSVVEAEIFVAGSVNVYKATFDFDDSWEGYAANAIFEVPGADPIEVLVSDDACEIPWEVMSDAKKKFRVGIYGKKDGIRRPTLWTEYFAVAPGASNGVAARPAPAPDIYEQLLDSITKTGTAKEYAEQAEASANTAKGHANTARVVAKEARDFEVSAAASAQVCEETRKRVEDLMRVVNDAAMHVDEARWHTDERAIYAEVMASTADANAQSAQKASQAAESSVAATQDNARVARQAAQESMTHAEASSQAASTAASEAARAKAEADRAGAIAGGDFAAVPYVDQKALEAEQNANRYTDEQLANAGAGSAVSKTGDTMTGNLKMAEGAGITFQLNDPYAVPAVSRDVAYLYATQDENGQNEAFVFETGPNVSKVVFNTHLDLGGNRQVKNIGSPEEDNDAVSKAYVDRYYARVSHTSSSTTYGAGNGTKYGHVRLYDSPNGDYDADSGRAVTPYALQRVSNVATAAQSRAEEAYGLATNANASADEARAGANEALYQVSQKAFTQTFSATVPAGSWTAVYEVFNGVRTTYGYKRTITVPGIYVSDNPVADVELPSLADSWRWPAANDYLEAWSHVVGIETQTDAIVVYVDEIPDAGFNIQLKVVR